MKDTSGFNRSRGVHSAQHSAQQGSQELWEFYTLYCGTTNGTELETLPSAEWSMAQLSQKAQGLDLQTLKLTDAQVLCVTQYGEYSIRQLSSAIF